MSNKTPANGNKSSCLEFLKNNKDFILTEFIAPTISGIIAGTITAIMAGLLVTYFQPKILELSGVVKPEDKKEVIDCKRRLNNKGFTELESLCSPLKNNFLKTADQETYEAIGKIIHGDNWGKGKKTTYTAEAIQNKNICKQLIEIDELWKEASKGKLGFSVQKNIWEKNTRIYQKFIKTVGWLNSDGGWNRSLSYELENIPNGHLPALWNQKPEDSLSSSKKEYETFFELFEACE